jgi:uncharacterized membrane protein YqaE (UPF0057 family)
MTEEPNKPILEYGVPNPLRERQSRRILLCIALPMIGFGLAHGFGNDNVLNGGVTAIGAFILAFIVRVPE